MKKFRLLLASFLLVGVAMSASAQRQRNHRAGNYEPTVFLISVSQTDSIPLCNPCKAGYRNAAVNNLAMQQAISDYNETWRPGFQQVEKPLFIFTTKNNKFSFAVGGEINLRASYEFNGIVNNIDFVPYDIPVPGNYASKQRLNMDASTSKIFIKAIANTRTLGRVVVFVDTDFRGGNGTNYTPRIRSAFVAFKGFTFGRDVTTFCDLQAAPTTIDYQGPNAYNYRYSTMIRYEFSCANDHLQAGAAAELPRVSGTYGAFAQPIPQRVPDFPVYLQLSWGAERRSHFRASAVFRDMYLYNAVTDNVTTRFGWGVQASGNIMIGRVLNLFFNGVYGKGITPYLQDIAGAGLDFTPNPENAQQIQTMPMYGWQAAAQINLFRNLSLSGGYSAVTVEKEHGAYADNEYRRGQYIFGNIFYHITPRFKIAGEYLYGTRKNMNGEHNHANRVNVMAQYNF